MITCTGGHPPKRGQESMSSPDTHGQAWTCVPRTDDRMPDKRHLDLGNETQGSLSARMRDQSVHTATKEGHPTEESREIHSNGNRIPVTTRR